MTPNSVWLWPLAPVHLPTWSAPKVRGLSDGTSYAQQAVPLSREPTPYRPERRMGKQWDGGQGRGRRPSEGRTERGQRLLLSGRGLAETRRWGDTPPYSPGLSICKGIGNNPKTAFGHQRCWEFCFPTTWRRAGKTARASLLAPRRPRAAPGWRPSRRPTEPSPLQRGKGLRRG